MIVRSTSYHLLVSDGGRDCICIIESPAYTKFTEEQKNKMIELYGEYIIISIHPKSLDCFTRLDIINDINGFLKL